MTQGLILIDIQNDYFPAGKMELVQIDQAARNASRVLTVFRKNQLPIFHVQHISNRPGATFFLPDTPGVDIHASVTPHQGETLVTKQFPNAFRETELLDLLNRSGIREIVICGAMSHMCVDATVRAGFDLGFQCTVIADACATRDLAFSGLVVEAAKVHAAFMAALSAPYARVMSAEDFITQQPD
ncbi:cysteine hydrolase [bacterium]|nr:cysteine hydrolase [bacterium]